MKITFVKKILANGSPCQKCSDFEQRLVESGQLESINEIIIADERDPLSAGMVLAKKYQVDRAPFFVVEDDDNNVSIYTVYFQFAKEILDTITTAN